MGALYSCGPQPAVTGVNADHSLANLKCYRWQMPVEAYTKHRLPPEFSNSPPTGSRSPLTGRTILLRQGSREPRPIGPRMGALYDDGKFIIETELITSFLVLIRAPHAPDGLDAICVFLSGRPRLCQLFEVRPALPLRIRGKHADVPRFPCGSCPGHGLRQRVRVIAVPFAR